jgi:hypothetical protein
MAEIDRNLYRVEVLRIDGLGSNWIVRVSKKFLFWRRRVSSDWFLDEAQAERFAQQLRKDLVLEEGLENLKERRPGWTLHRPGR